MKIVTVIGARPQFIKAAAVSRALSFRPAVREVLIHTGQHYDANMSEVFFREMDIPHPNYHLGIGGGLHGAMTGQQLERIEEVLLKELPDWVLVYGDTNSTLAGALAAAKLHIPIAHVESGLRSFNRRMPEEVNRVLTDHMSTLLFAPSGVARKNLLAEGIDDSAISVVGDVMYDATIFYQARASQPAWFLRWALGDAPYVLCTIHRAENTEDLARLGSILEGLATSGLPVVLPMHPRTKARMNSGGLSLPHNVFAVDPVGYLEMCWLEAHCSVIATDSGGVQKEAYFHGKPCVTLRDETEWVELINVGANVIVGTDPALIASAITSSIDRPVSNVPLYGDGTAAKKIAELLS